VVLAANRDESTARPFDPPRRHDGPVPFLAPVDRTAGGTWLGMNAAGLVVAVTNRPQREVSATRRSRGLLVLDALVAPDLSRLRRALERHLRSGAPYNNFHLVAASVGGAFVVRYHDGWTELTDLDEGDHFLTNHDELDEPRVEALASAPGAAPEDPAAAEADRIAPLLACHDPVLPGGRPVCKHGEGYGTVSSAVLGVPETGLAGAVFLFAPGPPCTTPFLDLSAAARALAP